MRCFTCARDGNTDVAVGICRRCGAAACFAHMCEVWLPGNPSGMAGEGLPQHLLMCRDCHSVAPNISGKAAKRQRDRSAPDALSDVSEVPWETSQRSPEDAGESSLDTVAVVQAVEALLTRRQVEYRRPRDQGTLRGGESYGATCAFGSEQREGEGPQWVFPDVIVWRPPLSHI